MLPNTASLARVCFTSLVLQSLSAASLTSSSAGKWWLFPLAFIPGYGAAWIGHFFIEKNKPATFQYPLWSFMGDYKMIWLMLTGRMDGEVERNAKAAASYDFNPQISQITQITIETKREPQNKSFLVVDIFMFLLNL